LRAVFLPFGGIDVSSSMLRGSLTGGAQHLLPAGVAAYIHRHGVYKIKG